MKKRMKNRRKNIGIMRLEERVLFEAAAAPEIAALAAAEAEAQQEAQEEAQQVNENKDTQQESVQEAVEAAQNAGPDGAAIGDGSVVEENAQIEAEGLGSQDADDAADSDSGDSAQGITDETATQDSLTDDSDADDTFSQVPENLDADGQELPVITQEAVDAEEDINIEDPSSVVIEQSKENITVDAEAGQQTAEQTAEETADEINANSQEAAAEADAAAAEKGETPAERHELVIINSSTADIDTLVAQVGEGRDVLIVDASSEDPLADIDAYMASRDYTYDAVHIVTHGNDTGLRIGSEFVTDGKDFGFMKDHLSQDADVMVYGCSTASSEQGQAFLHDIADATGADIAASTDITGSSDVGGDWDLEYSIGVVDTDAVSVSNDWNGRLATISIGTGETYENLYAYWIGQGETGTDITLDGTDEFLFTSSVAEDTSVTSITITGDVSFSSSGAYSYTFNHAITVNAGKTLTVGDGTNALTLNANITDAGTLQINNATISGVELNGGSLTNSEDGTITDVYISRGTFWNAGTVTNVKATSSAGAFLKVAETSEIENLYVRINGNEEIETAPTGTIRIGFQDIDDALDAYSVLPTGDESLADHYIFEIALNSYCYSTDQFREANDVVTAEEALTINRDHTLASMDFTTVLTADDSVSGYTDNSTATLNTIHIADGVALTLNNNGTFKFDNVAVDVKEGGTLKIEGATVNFTGNGVQANYKFKTASTYTFADSSYTGASIFNAGTVTISDTDTHGANVNFVPGGISSTEFSNIENYDIIGIKNTADTAELNISSAKNESTVSLNWNVTTDTRARNIYTIWNDKGIVDITGSMGYNNDEVVSVYSNVNLVTNRELDSTQTFSIALYNTSTTERDSDSKLENASGVLENAAVYIKDSKITTEAQADSKIIIIPDGGIVQNLETAFAVKNNATMYVEDSFLSASGNNQVQTVYNDLNGVFEFNVGKDVSSYYHDAQSLDKYWTARNVDWSDVSADPSHLIPYLPSISTSGSADKYSVYNVGQAYIHYSGTLETDAAAWKGDSSGYTYDNVPVVLLNGDVITCPTAQSAVSVVTDMDQVTVLGNITGSGTSHTLLNDVVLTGKVTNTSATFAVTGVFSDTAFTIYNGTSNLLDWNSDTATVTISATGNADTQFGIASTGSAAKTFHDSVYTSKIQFNDQNSYIFTNTDSNMVLKNFTGLGADKNHAVQFTNKGSSTLTIDASDEDASDESDAYVMYVTNTAEYAGDGVENTGILNYRLTTGSPTLNITNVEVTNTNSYSAAITNIAGIVNMTGGRALGTYSGIDSQESSVTVEFSPNLHVWQPEVNLKDVVMVGGTAYGIRNAGDLNISSSDSDSDATVITNNLLYEDSNFKDVSLPYVTNAIGLYNILVAVQAHAWSDTVGQTTTYGYEVAINSEQAYLANEKSLTSLPTSVKVTFMKAGGGSSTAVDLSVIRENIQGGKVNSTKTIDDVVHTYVQEWFGNAYGKSTTNADNITFTTTSGITSTAIVNESELSVTGIQSFEGYEKSITNQDINSMKKGRVAEGSIVSLIKNWYGWDLKGEPKTSSDTVPYMSDFNSDVSVSANLSFSSTINISQIDNYSTLTLDGIDGSGILNISAPYTNTKTLTLKNLTILAPEVTTNAIINSGKLAIVNDYSIDDSQMSSTQTKAYISAPFATAIKNNGTLTMINATIRDSKDGINNTGTMYLLNSQIINSTDWAVINSGTANILDSSIVYNANGIDMQAGTTTLVNTILANSGRGFDYSTGALTGTANGINYQIADGATFTYDGRGNQIGSEDDALKNADLLKSIYNATVTFDPDYNTFTLAEGTGNPVLNGGVLIGITLDDSGMITKYTYSTDPTKFSGFVLVAKDKDNISRLPADCGGDIVTGATSTGKPVVPYSVNTLTDDTDAENEVYSLREIIGMFNEGIVSTVEFDAEALNTEAESAGVWDFELKGDEIEISKDLILDESKISGAKAITITASAMSDNMFAVADKTTVTFTGIDLKGPSSGSIFEIAKTGTVVNLNSLTVSGSEAGSSAAAIVLTAGTLNAFDVTFIGNNNTAGNGGAISVSGGTLNVTDSTFSGNKAAGNGGAIYNNGGTVSVKASAFYENTAADGYALYNNDGTMDVSASTIANHGSSETPDTANGAVTVAGGELNLYNVTIGLNNTIGLKITGGTATAANTLIVGNLGDTKAENVSGELGEGETDNLIGGTTVKETKITVTKNLVFGDNVLDTKTGVIALSVKPDNPALDGNLAANADESYTDQLGVDRSKTSKKITYGAYQSAPAGNVVTTAADIVDDTDDVISLREAVAFAMTESGGGKVYFDSEALGKGSVTITLDSALGAITLNGVAINGVDDSYNDHKTQITVSGGNKTSIFTVSGENNEINDITVANGSGTNGGAVSVSRLAALTVANTGFTGNTAAGSGGAIYIESEAVVTIKGTVADDTYSTVFSNNSAASMGGAIYNLGTLNLANVKFEGNTSASGGGAIYSLNQSELNIDGGLFASNHGGIGGALDMSGGDVVFKGKITFDGNISDNEGGAMQLSNYTTYRQTVTVDSTADLIFSNNKAETTGGAIDWDPYNFNAANNSLTIKDGAKLTFTGNSAATAGAVRIWAGFTNEMTEESGSSVTFEGNTATTGNGGALYVAVASGTAKTLDLNSALTFSNNKAEAGNGGAVYVGDGVTLNVNGKGTFFNNKATTGSGGAIYVAANATVNVVGAAVEAGADYVLRFDTNSAGGMGGAINNEGILNVSNVDFSNNTSKGGLGGGAINSNNTLTVNGAKFYNNSDTMNGGAIDINKGTAEFSGTVTFDSNRAVNGGAVQIGNGQGTAASLTINAGSNITFIKNTATTGNGGAIDFDAASPNTLTINDTAQLSFISNEATSGDGGAMYLQGTLENNLTTGSMTFSGNRAEDGGAVYLNGEYTYDLKHSTFSNNGATGSNGSGGAIFNVATLTVTDGEISFTGNTAGDSGGAIYSTGSTTITADKISFTGNTADSGGAIESTGSTTITAGEISFTTNIAGDSGGAIFSRGSTTITADKISFTGNTAGYDGGAIYQYEGTVRISTSSQSPADATKIIFSKNIAGSEGGAIYQQGGNIFIQAAAFYENSADDGYAVYLLNGAMTISASTFANHGKSGTPDTDDGTVSVEGGVLSLNNVTIGLNNTIGLKITDGAVTAANTLIVGNLGDTEAENVSGELYEGVADNLIGGTIVKGTEVTVTRQLVFGKNTFDYDKGVISLNLYESPAYDGHLAANADGTYTDQLGKDRRQTGEYVTYGAYQMDMDYVRNVVTTINDTVILDGYVSLREALAYVNENGGPIYFDADALAEFAKGSSVNLTVTLGTLEVTGTVDIQGVDTTYNPETYTIAINGADTLTSSVFTVAAGSALSVSDVTITGNAVNQPVIDNAGTLTLNDNVMIGNNATTGTVVAISNKGTVTGDAALSFDGALTSGSTVIGIQNSGDSVNLNGHYILFVNGTPDTVIAVTNKGTLNIGSDTEFFFAQGMSAGTVIGLQNAGTLTLAGDSEFTLDFSKVMAVKEDKDGNETPLTDNIIGIQNTGIISLAANSDLVLNFTGAKVSEDIIGIQNTNTIDSNTALTLDFTNATANNIIGIQNAINYDLDYNGTTYTWDGTAWKDASGNELAYDPNLDLKYNGVTYTWDGTAWVNAAGKVLVYDPNLDLTYNGTTYTWDGTAWKDASGKALEYDKTHSTLEYNGVTYTWTGTAWVNAAGNALVYDPNLDLTYNGVTYTWNVTSNAWKNASGKTLAYDPNLDLTYNGVTYTWNTKTSLWENADGQELALYIADLVLAENLTIDFSDAAIKGNAIGIQNTGKVAVNGLTVNFADTDIKGNAIGIQNTETVTVNNLTIDFSAITADQAIMIQNSGAVGVNGSLEVSYTGDSAILYGIENQQGGTVNLNNVTLTGPGNYGFGIYNESSDENAVSLTGGNTVTGFYYGIGSAPRAWQLPLNTQGLTLTGNLYERLINVTVVASQAEGDFEFNTLEDALDFFAADQNGKYAGTINFALNPDVYGDAWTAATTLATDRTMSENVVAIYGNDFITDSMSRKNVVENTLVTISVNEDLAFNGSADVYGKTRTKAGGRFLLDNVVLNVAKGKVLTVGVTKDAEGNVTNYGYLQFKGEGTAYSYDGWSQIINPDGQPEGRWTSYSTSYSTPGIINYGTVTVEGIIEVYPSNTASTDHTEEAIRNYGELEVIGGNMYDGENLGVISAIETDGLHVVHLIHNYANGSVTLSNGAEVSLSLSESITAEDGEKVVMYVFKKAEGDVIAYMTASEYSQVKDNSWIQQEALVSGGYTDSTEEGARNYLYRTGLTDGNSTTYTDYVNGGSDDVTERHDPIYIFAYGSGIKTYVYMTAAEFDKFAAYKGITDYTYELWYYNGQLQHRKTDNMGNNITSKTTASMFSLEEALKNHIGENEVKDYRVYSYNFLHSSTYVYMTVGEAAGVIEYTWTPQSDNTYCSRDSLESDDYTDYAILPVGKDNAVIYNDVKGTVTVGALGSNDGSSIIMLSGGSAVYNSGSFSLYNGYVSATGLKSIGVFNSTSASAEFKVDMSPETYLTADELNEVMKPLLDVPDGATEEEIEAIAEQNVAIVKENLSAYGNLIYHISGSGYSIYNMGQFTVSTTNDATVRVVSEDGSFELFDAPTIALNGDVYTQCKASSEDFRTITDLDSVSVNGSVESHGTAYVYLDDVYLNGHLINQGANIEVTGSFRANAFKIRTAGDVYTAEYSDTIYILNDSQLLTTNATYLTSSEKLTNYSGVGGNIYFGGGFNEIDGKTVSFYDKQTYQFVNVAGKMSLYEFTGLGTTKENPVAIFNTGEFYMDPDRSVKTAADLYVTEFTITVQYDQKFYTDYFRNFLSNMFDFQLNSKMSVTMTFTPADVNAPDVLDIICSNEDGTASVASVYNVKNAGIVNMDVNTYVPVYMITNNMVLSDLNIRNVNQSSAAVTNGGGNLTINRGSLQGTYSGIDSLVDYVFESPKDMMVKTGVVSLNDVEKISGAAYSIRNSSDLYLNGNNVTASLMESDSYVLDGKTLLDNTLDFASNHTGAYTAVATFAPSMIVHEHYESTTSKYNTARVFLNTGMQAAEHTFTLGSNSGTSLVQAGGQFEAYRMSSASVTTRKTLRTDTDLSVIDATHGTTSPKDWVFGNIVVESNTVLDHVAFHTTSSPLYETIVFDNWSSNLTVTDIEAGEGYQFVGFTESIYNGVHPEYFANIMATVFPDDYLTSAKSTRMNSTADIEVGFQLPANQIVSSNEIAGTLTLRGVSPTNIGTINVDGGAYTVYANQTLNLINMSVLAEKSNAIYNAGILNIYNGDQVKVKAEDGSEVDTWQGISMANIQASNSIAIENTGKLTMVNGAIVNSKVGIQQYGITSSVFTTVLNSTFYNNSEWAIYTGESDFASTVTVADTTIVSSVAGSGGINMQSGTLNLVNSIVLTTGANSMVIGKDATVKYYDNPQSNIIGGYDSDGEKVEDQVADTSEKMISVFGTTVPALDQANGYVVRLAQSSTALTKGVDLYYTIDENGFYTFSTTVVQETSSETADTETSDTETTGTETADTETSDTETTGTETEESQVIQVKITWDKIGLERDQAIGSYSGKGIPGPEPTLGYVVNTFIDDIDGENDKVSLREYLSWMQSSENTSLVTSVQFDYAALVAEAGTETGAWVFQLAKENGTLMVGTDWISTVSMDGSYNGIIMTIDGSALNVPVFTVSAAGITLSLSNLVVNGASAEDDPETEEEDEGMRADGAGIHVAAGNLALNGVTVQNGMTTGNGGAIYLKAGTTLDSKNSTFTNNNALNGGAIYCEADISVSGGSFNGNIADNGAALYGADITVSGSTFTGNVGTNSVIDATGGIRLSGVTMTEGNTAAEGSLVRADGDVTVESGSRISTTNAIYLLSGENVTVSGSTLSDSTVTSLIDTDGSVSISDNSTLSNNTVTSLIDTDGDVSVTGSTVSGNKAFGNLINGSNITFADSSIINNAANGAVIHAEQELILENTKISENNPVYNDGSRILDAENITMTNTVISDNKADENIIDTIGFTMEGSTISGNSSYSMNIIDSEDVSIINSTLYGNDAEENIISGDGKIFVQDSVMYGNTGAALIHDYADDGNIAVITSTFADTDGNGTTVVESDGDVYIVNSTIGTANTPDYVVKGNRVYVTNSIIATNGARATEGNLIDSPYNVISTDYDSVFGDAQVTGRYLIPVPAIANMRGSFTQYSVNADGSLNIRYSDSYQDEVISSGNYFNPLTDLAWHTLTDAAPSADSTIIGYSHTQYFVMPGIGAYWNGSYTVDYGPGLNIDFANPLYNGTDHFFDDDKYAASVRGIMGDLFTGEGIYSYSLLTESGWDIFAGTTSGLRIVERADLGDFVSGESFITETVDAVTDDLDGDLVIAPTTGDGVPVGPVADEEEEEGKELASISEVLGETSEKIASVLRRADVFKDGFDRALEELLGIKA